ncbi:RNA polymerase sigma factor [Alicyclobacillus fodiniaquatilis]|uniref:RNA polymerase sigma factor n=1 Tax=Alicyclobacillus fodiniaquatilis TaxID=1661150 RepID=A0ABW4JJ23_9BACL
MDEALDENLDQSLLRIRQGDVEALHTLYTILRVPVYSVALSIVRNHALADEVLQETFVRVYDRVERYHSGSNPKAWVISIARNIALDLWRSSKFRNEKHVDFDTVSPHPNYTGETAIVQRITITEVLSQLDDVEREIVVLHVVAGFKHAEISKEFDIPEGTVRWKYRQALKRLSYLVGGTCDEPGRSDVEI